jgi:hypothetical protein
LNPPGVVIAFGVIGTTIVGVIYAAPSQALRREARALVRLLAPFEGKKPAELREELDARENLERQLVSREREILTSDCCSQTMAYAVDCERGGSAARS